jgi:hypothetical protein
MLNPRTYLEDCVRYTKQTLWRTQFPWEVIYRSIDNETFEYTQNDELVTLSFLQTTEHHWDPLRDGKLKKVTCPRCVKVNEGQAFRHLCWSCGFAITHEKLRVGKFIDDAFNVVDKRRPLAGTILNSWGQPAQSTTGKKLGTHDAFFPSRIVEKGIGFKPHQLRAQADQLTVEALKAKFTLLLHARGELEIINSEQKVPGFVAKPSKIAVRKVLSHYWDNSSYFGIDLVGAVLRQGSFVQKMRKLDWLHSPSVITIVPRLIVKYHRFVRLAADNPQKTVVPTLDVDLAWVRNDLHFLVKCITDTSIL